MSNTIQVYRRLLRSVDRNITAVTGNQLWRDFVRKEFRVERDALDVPELLQHATNYIFLVESVHKNRVCTMEFECVFQCTTVYQNFWRNSSAAMC